MPDWLLALPYLPLPLLYISVFLAALVLFGERALPNFMDAWRYWDERKKWQSKRRCE